MSFLRFLGLMRHSIRGGVVPRSAPAVIIAMHENSPNDMVMDGAKEYRADSSAISIGMSR